MLRTGLRRGRLRAPSSARGYAGLARPAGNFLTTLFPTGRQRIMMAFGADPDGDPALWQWTDVTTYFLRADGSIRITIGLAAKAVKAQPSSLAGTIRNDQAGGGDFTLGNPYGRFWPNVRENTPVLADLDLGSGPSVRFQGTATKIKPTRDANGKYNLVSFEAHGISRRVRKYDTPRSPMWRYHMLASGYPASTNAGWPGGDQMYHAPPAHYWPMEESSGAIRAVDTMDAGAPLIASTAERVPQFGGDTYLPGAQSLVRFGDGTSLSVTLPTRVAPGGRIDVGDPAGQQGIRVQILMRLDESAQTALRSALGTLVDGVTARILTIKTDFTSSTDIQQIVVWLDNDPTDGLLIYADTLKHDGTSASGAVLGGEVGLPFERGVYITLDIVQTAAGTVDVRLGHVSLALDPGAAFPTSGFPFAYFFHTLASTTLRGVTGLALAEFANFNGGALGQLSIYNGADDTFSDRYPRALLARSGDTVAERLYRLGIEQGVHIEVVGDCTDIPMGPQGTAGFADLLDECSGVDLGLLFDGLGPGYTYVARQAMYSRPADLTLDAGAGDELGPDDPDHTDDGRVNAYTASSGTGLVQTFTQTTGDLGTAAIGTLPGSGEHRAALEPDLYQIAAFKVGTGTVGGLTWPRLGFNLAKPVTSVKAQRWIEMLPGYRLDLLNAQPDLPEPDRSMLLYGWTEQWDATSFSVTANTGSYDPFAVALLADDTGTASEFLGWLDTEADTVLVAQLPSGYADSSTFEAGDEGWTPTSATMGTTSNASHSGTSSLTGTVTGAPAQALLRSPFLPVVAGQLYGASMWLQSPGGWASTQAAIDWYDASSAYLSTTSGTLAALPAGTWTQYTVSGTAPAGAAFAQYGPTLSASPPAGTGFKVDDAFIGPAALVATTTGPVCTNPAISTYADDIDGLSVMIDGIEVPVLAIAGSTSPQTFILDLTGVTRALPAGAVVSAANPVVLGL